MGDAADPRKSGHGACVGGWRTAGLVCLVLALAPGAATAAEGGDDLVLERAESLRANHQPHAGLAPRFGYELTWARLALEDDFGLRTSGDLDFRVPALLHDVDTRDAVWTAHASALPSMASAFGSLATSGMSLFEIWKNQRLRQRHFVRAYFKSNGAKLVWRIEF